MFFAALIYMPVTGFLTADFGGHHVKLFDALPTPLLVTPNKQQADLLAQLHLWGQWAIYVLIALHLTAVAFHLIFRHDGVLGRMLPANAAEPASGAEPRPQPRGGARPQPAYGTVRSP